jgi:DNA (cytosine-5)-methyltransferase 1
MTAYYNEFDKNAVQWLRELIKDGQIAPGDVDERSICDVRPDELIGYEQVHLFAGVATWSYALRQAGWPDTRSIWSASLPCQPFSSAGSQRGLEDDRHLWPVVYNLIKECRPSIIVGEQSASPKALEWWDAVANDLEAADYATAAVDMAGGCVGAYHQRNRLWWVATSSVGNANGQQPANSITGSGDDRNGSTRRLGTTEDRSSRPAIWENTHWLQCKDGKYRAADQDIYPLSGVVGMARGRIRGELERGLSELFGSEIDVEIIKGIAKGIDATRNWGSVKSKSLSMANGSAGGVGRSGSISQPINEVNHNNTQEARVMRLKGYGNSIVAPLAIEFIRSVMEII